MAMCVDLDHVGIRRIEDSFSEFDPTMRFHTRLVQAGAVDAEMQGRRKSGHHQEAIEK